MSDFKQTWIEGFNDLAIKIAQRYRDNQEEVLSSIGFKSVLDCLLETYNNLVGQKEILKLEELDEWRKKELWDKSKEYSDEQVKRIAICKAIYLLELLTKE